MVLLLWAICDGHPSGMGSVGPFSAAACADFGLDADDNVDGEGTIAGVGQVPGAKGAQASCTILGVEGDGFGMLSRAYGGAAGVRRGSGIYSSA